MSTFDVAGSRSSSPNDCLRDTPDARMRLAAMSAMASGLAHEVSQPLTTATNYLHACANRLRSRGEGYDEELAILNLAGREAIKVGEILRRMRGFIASGTIAGVRECLRAMIDRTGTKLACPDGSEVGIELSIPEDARFVVVARVQIEQVLSNILKNACEALDGCAERRIAISAVRIGEEVLVRIRDSGPGLSGYAQARLFEPLFTTRNPRIGLGLPICRAIVEAHGGRLWVESPAGGGAQFNLSLPAAG